MLLREIITKLRYRLHPQIRELNITVIPVVPQLISISNAVLITYPVIPFLSCLSLKNAETNNLCVSTLLRLYLETNKQ